MNSYKIRQGIATAALSMAATVLLLEFYGFIKHPSKAADEMTRFHSILPIQGGQYRMSQKLSPHQLRCQQGFATLITQDGPHGPLIQSLLLDANDRGVRCEPPATEQGAQGE